MDEESSSKGDGKVSRRDFLKMAGIIGAAAATGTLNAGCSDDEIPSKTPDPKAKATPVPVQAKPVEQKPIVISDETLFSNCTASEKSEGQIRINEQISHYQTNPDISARITQSKKWESMIRDCANKLGYNPNSFVISHLSSLIFVESEGDPKAISQGVGARGLCQLKWDTAQQAYGKVTASERKNIGISLSKPDDLLDSKTNITLGLQILAYYHECFPDPSLTFWVYHLGEGNLIRAMRAYLTSNKLMNDSELDKVLGDPTTKGTKTLVEKYKLNYIKLITSPAVIQKLKDGGAYQDDTQYYVPRIGAARYFLTK